MSWQRPPGGAFDAAQQPQAVPRAVVAADAARAATAALADAQHASGGGASALDVADSLLRARQVADSAVRSRSPLRSRVGGGGGAETGAWEGNSQPLYAPRVAPSAPAPASLPRDLLRVVPQLAGLRGGVDDDAPGPAWGAASALQPGGVRPSSPRQRRTSRSRSPSPTRGHRCGGAPGGVTGSPSPSGGAGVQESASGGGGPGPVSDTPPWEDKGPLEVTVSAAGAPPPRAATSTDNTVVSAVNSGSGGRAVPPDQEAVQHYPVSGAQHVGLAVLGKPVGVALPPSAAPSPSRPAPASVVAAQLMTSPLAAAPTQVPPLSDAVRETSGSERDSGFKDAAEQPQSAARAEAHRPALEPSTPDSADDSGFTFSFSPPVEKPAPELPPLFRGFSSSAGASGAGPRSGEDPPRPPFAQQPQQPPQQQQQQQRVFDMPAAVPSAAKHQVDAMQEQKQVAKHAAARVQVAPPPLPVVSSLIPPTAAFQPATAPASPVQWQRPPMVSRETQTVESELAASAPARKYIHAGDGVSVVPPPGGRTSLSNGSAAADGDVGGPQSPDSKGKAGPANAAAFDRGQPPAHDDECDESWYTWWIKARLC